MFGKKEIEQLKSIPLPDNTFQRRISNMATYVRNQEKIKFFVSSIVDELTGIASCGPFVAFAHCKFNEKLMKKTLFCKNFH